MVYDWTSSSTRGMKLSRFDMLRVEGLKWTVLFCRLAVCFVSNQYPANVNVNCYYTGANHSTPREFYTPWTIPANIWYVTPCRNLELHFLKCVFSQDQWPRGFCGRSFTRIAGSNPAGGRHGRLSLVSVMLSVCLCVCVCMLVTECDHVHQ